MSRYGAGVPWERDRVPGDVPVVPGASWESARPARPAEVGSDVFVPLGQSVITGLLVGALVTLLAGWVFHVELAVFDTWVRVALLVTTGSWLLLLNAHRKLLWVIESIVGADVTGDGVTGPPPKVKERVVLLNAGGVQADASRSEKQQAELEEREGAAVSRRSQFVGFVAGIPTVGTSMRAWEDVGLERELYQQFRDALIAARLASWRSTNEDGTVKNERLGWTLSVPPEWIIERVQG